MDYNLVSYDSESGLVCLTVLYQTREICMSTYFYVNPGTIQDSEDWNGQVDPIVQSVLDCVSPTVDNPNYDASLTGCWV